MPLRRFSLIRVAIGLSVLALAAGTLSACKGGGGGGLLPAGAVRGGGGAASMSRVAPPMSLAKPSSQSPALVPPAPMAQTAILPSSVMTSASTSHSRRPMQPVSGSSWTGMPGAATQIFASPDGTVWALGTTPATGTDRSIWHYTSGRTWVNIPGLASHLALSPTGVLYAVNSGGGIYSWNGNSNTWTAIAGGASAIAIASDGSIYVLSNGGSGDRAIWHSTNGGGSWTQLPGAGVALSASWDPASHTAPGGAIAAGGFFIIDAEGYIYYGTSGGTFVAFDGGASGVSATTIGGFFVIGYPVNNTLGNQVYYWNLANAGGGWSYQTGAGLSVSASANKVYVVTVGNAIYVSKVTGSGRAAGPGTALTGPTYGGNNAGCADGGGFICDGYAPEDIATRLQFPAQQGYDGRGQTVAIVIDSDLAAGDLTAYTTYNQTPSTGRTVTTESVDSGTGVTSGQGEATLDEETIAGLAPGANIILYEMPDLTDASIDDAYNKILSDGTAKVVSSSFGGCEGVDSTTTDTILATGAQAGVVFVASSGDQGNECYNGTGYSQGANFPASDPNVVGIGGNETYPTSGDAITNPVVWNDSTCGGPCAGGGGVSTTFALPGYQQGLSGVSSTTFRNVPDVSMPAQYTAVYENGAWGLSAGTSWSAPEYAALMAEVYEYCGTAIENAVTLPYNVYASVGYNAFIDVTSGNDQYGGAAPYYTAATGYDNASGIGVPLGVPFANAACPSNQLAGIILRPEASVQYAAHRRAAAFTVRTALNVHGLVDLGRRGASDVTRIQLVLEPTSTLAGDEESVVATLQNAGFTIVQRFSNHLVVDATAPSETVERFFSTQLHNVSQGIYGTRYMPVTTATVPASIAPDVAGVILNNVVTEFAPNPVVPRRR
ncbi:MAG: tectonin domain-containing protein [Candidatus Tyrphobacter sp.]